MQLTDTTHDLLVLAERESEVWPFTALIEMEGQVLAIRSLCDPRGCIMLGKVYTLVSPDACITLDRMGALRSIEAELARQQEAAVLEAIEVLS